MTAPTITGSITQIQNSSTSASQSVSIPADAELCIVGIAFWRDVTGGGRISSMTLDSNSFTSIVTSNNSSYGTTCLWRLIVPSGIRGTSKTLAWTFDGALSEGANLFVIFLKDVDTSGNPVRGSGTGSGDPNSTTASYSSSTNDLNLCVGYSFNVDDCNAAYGSGQTEVADSTAFNSCQGAVGTKAGVSGTTTMAVSGAYTSVCACSIIGTSGAVSVSGAGAVASAEAFGTSVASLNTAPTSIAGAELFGTQSAQANLSNLTGIASTEAMGTPVVGGALAPAGIASGEANGTPALSVNIVNGGAIASGEAVGSQSIQAGLANAGGIAAAEVFGTPVITLAVNPASLGSGEAVGTPAPSVNVASAGNIASAEAFGSPNVSTISPVNLTAVGNIAGAEAFGTPTFSVAVATAGIASQETVGASALGVAVAGAGNIASAEAFGTLTVSAGAAVNLTDAGGIASGEAFGTASVSPQVTLVSPAGALVSWANIFSWLGIEIADWYLLNVMDENEVTLIANWYTAVAVGQGVGDLECAISPAELASLANGNYKWRVLDYGGYGYGVWTAFLPFSLDTVSLTDAGGIAGGDEVGSPSLSATIAGVGGIASAEALGTPGGAVSIEPAGTASDELFGLPKFVVNIQGTGIDSGEAFGNTIVYVGSIDYGVIVRGIRQDQIVGKKGNQLIGINKRQLL